MDAGRATRRVGSVPAQRTGPPSRKQETDATSSRHLIAAPVAAATLALTATPAFAFDCLRASSSMKGLQQSTKSGNWLYFTIQDFAQGAVAEGAVTQAQADCAVDAWIGAGEPQYFALGVGVAGAHGATQSGRITDSDFFELAHNAPLKVMTNGTGVDHFEDALFAYAAPCLG
jgi:hypothetical protein